ncbi:MAG: serine hydrolase [Bacteroidales bacterium]|nr:serine hydrolase [Bacteroidales bacterium]
MTIFVASGSKSLDTPSVQMTEQPVAERIPVPLAPPIREFVRFMEQELDSSSTVGAAFTIVHAGKIVYTGTYGEREYGSRKEVDEHTLFRLASVSKGFAGVLAGMLEQDGAFSLNDRVVDHYPGFSLKDSVNTAGLTIKHLLSHTSGLVPYAFDNLVEANQELYTIIDHLDEVDISAPPGELYGYQNVMFSMFDPIARRSTGIPYPVLLQEKIFKPLGMRDASAGPIELNENSNMAFPHVRTSKGYVALQPHEGYYNVLPAAGVNASISDMGQWLLALLGHRKEWMSETLISKISTPVIYTPLKWQYTRYWKPFRERYYSLGWRIYQYQGRKIIYHGGYIRGYRAEIAFCPSEDVGIAFLQNSPNDLASRCVPAFMDLFLESI